MITCTVGTRCRRTYPHVGVGVVRHRHAPVDHVIRARRRRAEEESNDSKHLELAIDSTGSIDAGVFDATEQNAGKPNFSATARRTRV